MSFKNSLNITNRKLPLVATGPYLWHSNCTKRFVGNTLGTYDTWFAQEPNLHMFGHYLMLANKKQWQTGGQLASKYRFK
jgi:hypothetical protein